MRLIHFVAESVLKDIGHTSDDLIQNKHWAFNHRLTQLAPTKLARLLCDLPLLQIKYHTLCAAFANHSDFLNQEQQAEYAASILMMSQILIYFRVHYTQMELNALHRTQSACQFHLEKLGIIFNSNALAKEQSIEDSQDAFIRAKTTQADFWRLLLNRTRRVLFWSLPILSHVKNYSYFMAPIELFLRRLMIYQALVLVPRLISNLAYIFKHWWMPNNIENTLSWLTQLQVHLTTYSRWWEIAYDMGWIVTGLLTGCILVGTLAPLAIYCVVTTPLYNLSLHTTRFYIEDARFKSIEETYRSVSVASLHEKKDIKIFLEQLNTRRAYHQNNLLLRMMVSSWIVLTGIFFVWTVMPPVIPLVAAIISVLITIAGAAIPSYLPKQNDQIFKHTFFFNQKHLKPSQSDNCFLNEMNKCSSENTVPV